MMPLELAKSREWTGKEYRMRTGGWKRELNLKDSPFSQTAFD